MRINLECLDLNVTCNLSKHFVTYQKNLWPIGNFLWPIRKILWPIGNIPWPIGNIPWPIVKIPWPIGNIPWPIGKIMWPIGNIPWPIGNIPWPIGNIPWPIVKIMWPIGNIPWPIGNILLPIGNTKPHGGGGGGGFTPRTLHTTTQTWHNFKHVGHVWSGNDRSKRCDDRYSWVRRWSITHGSCIIHGPKTSVMHYNAWSCKMRGYFHCIRWDT